MAMQPIPGQEDERRHCILTIDCRGVADEAGFWQRYVDAARPEGARFFGRNLDAFRDALQGGPGWPDASALHFIHTRMLALADPAFVEKLPLAVDGCPWIRLCFHEGDRQ
jgi:ribonuclease inhibitor